MPIQSSVSCLLPVEILMHLLRSWASSAAVMKPAVGCPASEPYGVLVTEMLTRSFLAASLIFSTLVSERPLILKSFLLVVPHKVYSRLLAITQFGFL
jgi:hypothetical protein